MKTKPLTIILILAILLIAFITNPSKDKHVNNAVEIIFNEDNDLGILSGLVETLYKPTIAPKVKMDNYFLFSISYLNLKEDNERVNLGVGLFGQVLSINDSDKLKELNGSNSNRTLKELNNNKPEDSETQKKLKDLIGD